MKSLLLRMQKENQKKGKMIEGVWISLKSEEETVGTDVVLEVRLS